MEYVPRINITLVRRYVHSRHPFSCSLTTLIPGPCSYALTTLVPVA